jgi:cytoskeleton protein RodZ
MASQEPKRDDITSTETAHRRLHLREVRTDRTSYEGIGVEMRAARIRSGAELSDIAQKLRISQAYLQAIEEGRFDRLPGHVYVFGFLKTYARFLELDEDIVVDRFKTETTGRQHEARLEFPSAMDRGRLPSGRLLLGGLVIAVLAYAGWFVITSEERSTADRVTAIPERLVPTVATKATSAPSPVAVTPTELGVESAPAVVLAIPVVADSAADLDVTAAEPSAPASIVDETPAVPTTEEVALETAPVVVVNQPEPESALEAEVMGTDVGIIRSASPSNAFEVRQLAIASSAPIALEETATLPVAADQGSTLETAAARSPAAPAVVVNSPDGSANVAARSDQNTPPPLAVTGDSATAAPSAGGYVPQVFGAGNEDARIVLIAESESWVQVRATSGELLLTRVLRPGDRYLVPDRPGLVMMTGNLGALRVIVDGEAAPGLGPLGVIGRDIPLDANRLLSGQVSADFDAE